MRASRVGRSARHDLQPVLAAARRRRARPRRRDRRRGLHPAAHPESRRRPLPRHPAPRGAGAVRRDRRAGAGGLGGDRDRLARARAARCSAHSRPEQVRQLRAGRAAERGSSRCASETGRPPYRGGAGGRRCGARRLRAHARADGHLLGCRRVHRRRASARHPASARHAALRADRARLGAARAGRRVRRPDQPAERPPQRGRGGLLLPRGPRVARARRWSAGCASARRRPRPARCSAASPSPTGRTRNETEVYAVATFTIAAMSLARAGLAPPPGGAAGRAAAAPHRLPGRRLASATTCSRCWPARPSWRSWWSTLAREPAADRAPPARRVGAGRGRRRGLGAADRHRPGQHRAHRAGRRSASSPRRPSPRWAGRAPSRSLSLVHRRGRR